MISTGLTLSDKDYYDFTLTVDILFTSSGVGGILFRFKDDFNFYAFIIDKNLGRKSIVKVVNNNITFLKIINDGGILMNNWHTVTINARAGSISVFIYDKENALKTSSENKIEVEDYTFTKGSVGVFVNGTKGLYFDEFSVKPNECFSAWQPIPNVEVNNSNSNIYVEDFTGSISEKYTTVDILDKDSRDGPANWAIINDDSKSIYITQTAKVYDSSSSKRPSIALINYLHFQNGTFKLIFNAKEPLGMVSIILKYDKQENDTSNSNEEFYSFDFVNDEKQNYFMFRKWKNGVETLIKRSVINETMNNSSKIVINKAYVPKSDTYVSVEIINNIITARISQDGYKYFEIFNIIDESIKAGTVGFGTYKTPAEFKSINLDPPILELTQKDIDFIMSSNSDDIALPSVIDINKTTLVSECAKHKSFAELTAMKKVSTQSTILGSVLGHDYCAPSSTSNSSFNSAKSRSNSLDSSDSPFNSLDSSNSRFNSLDSSDSPFNSLDSSNSRSNSLDSFDSPFNSLDSSNSRSNSLDSSNSRSNSLDSSNSPLFNKSGIKNLKKK